ncbi:hypothetical protein INS49_007499 [Diaporthe citri]|uniref:uncharacterized protein n=1 Tax=Diaporthe citri TaxID=83186 RepID=UPI001C7F4702|nr:uncharacterized protein INS49_007499 [Diaporthe citri]KAG6353327.1 hypothetical protein INS49_007499 [Diaporthe citri]
MNRSPLALDLGAPPPYRPVLRGDYFLLQQQHGGDGSDVHENHFEDYFGGEFANDLQLPDLPLGSSQSPSAGSARSALSSDDVDLPVSVSSGSDVRPDHDFDHGYDYDGDGDGDSDSQRPSAASPPSPSRSVPFALSLSVSPLLSAHSRQQAALVEFQNLQDQHEEAHEDAHHHNNEDQDDFPLREHLRLRRARRAARVAREAGRPRPARGNWWSFRPARRTAAEDFHESGQEDLDHSDSMDHDDELIEVVYQGPVAAPPTPPRRQQRHSRPQRQQRHHHHNHHQGRNLMEVDLDLDLDLDMDQHVPVIDLTEEPDSPELQRHRPINILRHNSHNHNHGHNHSHNHIHIFDDEEEEEEDGGIALYQPPRNPRRHMSQNGRMPSLNRSDGSILNGNAAVIDLTLDSPDDNIPADRRLPPPQAAAQLNQPANRNHRRLPAPASPAPAAAGAAPAHRAQYHDFGRHLIGSIRGLLPGLLAQAVNNPREAGDVQFVGAVPAFPMNPNPLAGNPPEFNYQANGFGGYGGRQPTPKPDFQAPPPSRPGFTRDTRPDGGETGADEELVVVCPSCDNELKYSPDDEDDSPRPAKRPRGKKSQEEHHFWAVKNCGHVYCKNCYDNRKKHSKGKDSAAAKTGFRFQPSETSKSIKIFCAVDDCESEVSPNAAWVGIFM